MFLYIILHFCIRPDVFLYEPNAKIWENLDMDNHDNYPTHLASITKKTMGQLHLGTEPEF